MSTVERKRVTTYQHRVTVAEEHQAVLARAFQICGFQSSDITGQDGIEGELGKCVFRISLTIDFPDIFSQFDTITSFIRKQGVDTDINLGYIVEQILFDNMHGLALRLIRSVVEVALPDGVVFAIDGAEANLPPLPTPDESAEEGIKPVTYLRLGELLKEGGFSAAETEDALGLCVLSSAGYKCWISIDDVIWHLKYMFIFAFKTEVPWEIRLQVLNTMNHHARLVKFSIPDFSPNSLQAEGWTAFDDKLTSFEVTNHLNLVEGIVTGAIDACCADLLH